MTNLSDETALDDIDIALDAAESVDARSALAHLFLAEYRRNPARGWDAAIARVLSRAEKPEPRHLSAATTESVPSDPTGTYTLEQEAALQRLAQLVATLIKRDVDAQLGRR